MSRLDPAQPHGIDPIRRVMLSSAKRMFGRLPEPAALVAHHRPLLLGYSFMSLAQDRFSNRVPARLKQLAMLRTAQLTGCEWCLDYGSMLAREGGIAEEDLRELSIWRRSDRFEQADRLALEYAEAMTRTPVEVSEELFARLRERFDEPQIIELTFAIGMENLYSRTNWALGIEGQGFSEGTYCVRPEHVDVGGSLSSVDGETRTPQSV